jgi:hypothetical protein
LATNAAGGIILLPLPPCTSFSSMDAILQPSPAAWCPPERRSHRNANDVPTASCSPRRQRKMRWPCTMATATTPYGPPACSTAPPPGSVDRVHRPPGTDLRFSCFDFHRLV